MVMHVHNPNAWKVETGRSENRGHPLPQSEYQVSLGYLRSVSTTRGEGWRCSSAGSVDGEYTHLEAQRHKVPFSITLCIFL